MASQYMTVLYTQIYIIIICIDPKLSPKSAYVHHESHNWCGFVLVSVLHGELKILIIFEQTNSFQSTFTTPLESFALLSERIYTVCAFWSFNTLRKRWILRIVWVNYSFILIFFKFSFSNNHHHMFYVAAKICIMLRMNLTNLINTPGLYLMVFK